MRRIARPSLLALALCCGAIGIAWSVEAHTGKKFTAVSLVQVDLPDPFAQTQVALIKSEEILGRVLEQTAIADLGLDLEQLVSMISVKHPPRSNLIELRVSGDSAKVVRLINHAVLDTYLAETSEGERHKKRERLEQLHHALGQLTREIEVQERDRGAMDRPGHERNRGRLELLGRRIAEDTLARDRLAVERAGLAARVDFYKSKSKKELTEDTARMLDQILCELASCQAKIEVLTRRGQELSEQVERLHHELARESARDDRDLDARHRKLRQIEAEIRELNAQPDSSGRVRVIERAE